jgi:hypothetical protein
MKYLSPEIKYIIPAIKDSYRFVKDLKDLTCLREELAGDALYPHVSVDGDGAYETYQV